LSTPNNFLYSTTLFIYNFNLKREITIVSPFVDLEKIFFI
jgi:hypothetical protein